MNLPDDVLGKFASVEILTKKYVKKEMRNKMKICKVKYVCQRCGAKRSFRSFDGDRFRCKEGRCCDNVDYPRGWELLQSMVWTDVWGYNWYVHKNIYHVVNIIGVRNRKWTVCRKCAPNSCQRHIANVYFKSVQMCEQF